MNGSELPEDLAKSKRFVPEVRRRDFLGLAAFWSFLVTGTAMVVGLFRLPMPSVFPERGSKFRLGPPDRYPDGSVTILHDRNVLIGHDEKGLYAMSLVCPHLGCITRREPDGFFTCPCHGSRFDQKGAKIKGPTPSGLPFLEISISPSGDLMVDRARQVGEDARIHAGGEAG